MYQTRKTIIIVTHDPQIAQCAERIVYLKDGRIINEEKNANRRIIKI